MERCSETFGHFVEAEDEHPHLTMVLSSCMLARHDCWHSNNLSANFLGNYWESLFPVRPGSGLYRRKKIREMVSYIANELLENAVKYGYSAPPSGQALTIETCLFPGVLRFYVSHRIDPQSVAAFQEYIQILLTKNPERLYFRQMEQNADEYTHTVSRLGLLSILHDYHAQLAWKFDTEGHRADVITVTTMVQVAVQ